MDCVCPDCGNDLMCESGIFYCPVCEEQCNFPW